MIKVGIAGIGFMGWMHWLAYQRVEGIEVVAIASRDAKKRSGDWTSIQGNFGPRGEHIDVQHLDVHQDYSELLANPNVDLIDICVPPAQHVELTVQAAAQGKHVFCEKPLALDVSSADRMVAACQTANVQLAVGHVLPFFPEYRWALQQIQSGKYGSPIGGNFKRVISNPDWIPDFFDRDKIGGPLIDLHVHDAHLIRYLYGMPRRVFTAGRMRSGTVEYAQSTFLFEQEEQVVSSSMGVVHQPGRPFTHGFEIHLEQGTLQFEHAAFSDEAETMPVKLWTADGQVVRPQFSEGDPTDAFAAEITEVRDALRENRPSSLLSGALARDAVRLCEAQHLSAITRSVVDV